MEQSWLIYAFLVYISTVEGIVIGGRCNYDDDCFVEHSYCLRQEICECKEYFIPSNDMHFCIATIGAICNSRHDCSSLPNSDCIENNCLCVRGYVPDPHNAACKPASSKVGDQCEFDEQCQGAMGDFAVCTRGHCDCMPNSHFVNKCIKTKSLGDLCHRDEECYIRNQNRTITNMTICKNGQCSCRNGFRPTTDGYCRNSADLLRPMEQTLITLSIIFLVFIKYI